MSKETNKTIKGYNMNLAKFSNEDYQNRHAAGDAPRSNKPDSITGHGNLSNGWIEVSFKNTTERDAKEIAMRVLREVAGKASSITTYQDGDYHDDWVMVSFKFGKK